MMADFQGTCDEQILNSNPSQQWVTHMSPGDWKSSPPPPSMFTQLSKSG